jgi:hypothetical protein
LNHCNAIILVVVAPSLNKEYQYYFSHKRVEECSTWAQGRGTFKFDLLNMRLDYEFRYYRYLNGKHVHLVSSNRVTVCSTVILSFNLFQVDQNVPQHGHTSLTKNNGEIQVMWSSGTTHTPTVKYGFNPNSLSSISNGSSTTYELDHMCSDTPGISSSCFPNLNHYKGGEWAKEYYIPPGYIHRATMTGLQAGRTYYYQ